jgi:ABC-type glycerol-3-phosphate transport system substrate-binding protein
MKKRENVCLVLIAFCLILAAAACSRKTDSAGTAETETAAPKYAGETLNLLLSATPYSESIEPILKEFEKAYPGVTLNYDLLGRSNSDERTIIELSSGSDAHDIYYVYGESLIQFTGNDWLEPLDAYIADKSITNDAVLQLDDFSQGPLEACRYQGKLYGLPVFSATCIMYYRTDLFEQAGIAGPPKTWDELV